MAQSSTNTPRPQDRDCWSHKPVTCVLSSTARRILVRLEFKPAQTVQLLRACLKGRLLARLLKKSLKASLNQKTFISKSPDWF